MSCVYAFQEKKSKIAQELAASQQQMRGGGCSLSQGSRRILQERQRHTLKASQAAAAMAASGLLNQVCLTPAVLRCDVLCCAALCYAMLCHVVLCCAVLRQTLCCAVLCCAVLCSMACGVQTLWLECTASIRPKRGIMLIYMHTASHCDAHTHIVLFCCNIMAVCTLHMPVLCARRASA